MKKFWLLSVLLFTFFFAHSQKSEYRSFYTSLTIPDSLKKNANTVFRLDEMIVDIEAPGKYTEKVHQILTILNKDGSSHLAFARHIDKFEKIGDFEIRVFNALGDEVNKYKRKDLTTEPYFDGMSLVTDDKLVYVKIEAPAYPCTLELNYSVEVSSYIGIPSWIFQNHSESIENSHVAVRVPKSMNIRYKMKNGSVEPRTSDQDNKKIYSWEMRNLCAKPKENELGELNNLPLLMLACNEFSYDGYEGDFRSWQSFGNWAYPLYSEEKPPFNAVRKEELKKMVKDAGSSRKKAEILYKYMQDNSRYVSIQLGIGGFKPFPVAFVDEKKYGDCKALTNYMRHLLAEVGVKSYPALVYGGYQFKESDTDFPRSYFNHVILCIPEGKDTTWLECTSKTNDFGVLGPFTENRHALLLTENGGTLIQTPRSKPADNKFSSYTSIALDEDGGAKVHLQLSTLGEYKDNLINYFLHEKKDEQKAYLVNGLGIKQPDEFVMTKEDSGNILKVRLNITYDKVYEFAAGSKWFLNTRLYKFLGGKLPTVLKSSSEFNFDFPYSKSDTTVYSLPEGYVPDALPKEKNLSFSFGEYSSKYWYDEKSNSIFSTCKLILASRTIPAEKYEETQKFFAEVYNDNNQKLVIKKL